MQEEIEHKTVNFAISTTKLSARTLLRGMQFLLRQYDKHASQGKQSMKRLVRQNRGVTNVEIQKTGIQKLKPIIRSAAAYAPPEVVDGKPPVYPYTPIKSDFEDAETVEEMMLYTELQSAVHAMIQRLEYSFTFNPSLLTSPKRKKQVAEILTEAEKYIWRIKEEMRCA